MHEVLTAVHMGVLCDTLMTPACEYPCWCACRLFIQGYIAGSLKYARVNMRDPEGVHCVYPLVCYAVLLVCSVGIP